MTTITPEMIKAGVRAYRKADERFQSDEDIVAEIYAAMRLAVDNQVTSAKSLITGMLGITAYKIPAVDNPLPKRNPMIGCPFLDAVSPDVARQVLREGMADWHEGEPQWKDFISRMLGASDPSLPAPEGPPEPYGQPT
jgi:hypothetical protein